MHSNSEQIGLHLSDYPAMRPSALPVLDERLRGTRFVSLTPKSILNSPQQTGVDFWSLNPYVDRKSTRLNSSHQITSYAVFCLKKKKKTTHTPKTTNSRRTQSLRHNNN